MARAQVNMTLTVTFDPNTTDPESLASAIDMMLETALSTSGILDDYGQVDLGPVEVGAEVRLVEE